MDYVIKKFYSQSHKMLRFNGLKNNIKLAEFGPNQLSEYI